MALIYDSSHSGQEIDAAVDAVQTTIPSQLTQIGSNLVELESVLKEEEAITESATQTSSYIKTDGTIGSMGSANYLVYTYSIDGGKAYKITSSAYKNSLFYAFFDNSTFIGGLQAGNTSSVMSINDKVVVAPTNATSILVAGSASNAYNRPKVIGFSDVLKFYTKAEGDARYAKYTDLGFVEKMKELPIISDDAGYFINRQGVVTATTAVFHVITVSVTSGNTYYITASQQATLPFYAWYDANEALVQMGTNSPTSSFSTITDEEAVAPANAVYIKVCYHTTQTMAAVKYKVYEHKKKWYGKKWVCVGDSLTANNSTTTKHYFDYVADNTDITPINMGVGGSGYARGNGSSAFYQRISSIDTTADVVTIFGSFNDLGAGLDFGTYLDTDSTTIGGCINMTIDNLYTVMPLANLCIVAPCPWSTTQPTEGSRGYQYVELLKKICEHRSIPFLDLWRGSGLRPWDADFKALVYDKDTQGIDSNPQGTHPNEIGHKILSTKFQAFLETLLGSNK